MTSNSRKIHGMSLVILAFFLAASIATAQTCVTPPSCDTLGYKQSASDCSGQERVLKCPFDQTKMFCLDTITQEVNVGDILYSDMTVSGNIIVSKTPIGVVFDSSKRLAIALAKSGDQMTWDESEEGESYSIPGLQSIDSNNFEDGKVETAAIIAYGKSNGKSFPAAEYCNSYKTAGTKAGDWFLPSYLELQTLATNRVAVESTLESLGKGSIYNHGFWGSSICEVNSVWTKLYSGGKMGSYGPRNQNLYVYPVIEF